MSVICYIDSRMATDQNYISPRPTLQTSSIEANELLNPQRSNWVINGLASLNLLFFFSFQLGLISQHGNGIVIFAFARMNWPQCHIYFNRALRIPNVLPKIWKFWQPHSVPGCMYSYFSICQNHSSRRWKISTGSREILSLIHSLSDVYGSYSSYGIHWCSCALLVHWEVGSAIVPGRNFSCNLIM
jgi:hypothetical protein